MRRSGGYIACDPNPCASWINGLSPFAWNGPTGWMRWSGISGSRLALWQAITLTPITHPVTEHSTEEQS